MSRRGGRADAELQALADAGADGIDALVRAINGKDAVAPRRVALRHVAYPDRIIRHHRAQLIGESAVNAECGQEIRAHFQLQYGELGDVGRIDRHLALDPRQ